MSEAIISFFSQFPPELATFLLAMTPVGELRLALPVGVLGYKLPVWEVYLLAVAGNCVPAFLIAANTKHFHDWVNKRAGHWGKDWADYLASVQKKFAAGDWQVKFFVVWLRMLSTPFFLIFLVMI